MYNILYKFKCNFNFYNLYNFYNLVNYPVENSPAKLLTPCTGTNLYTFKPPHVVTSIKQSPVLKGNFFLSCHRNFHMNLTSFKRSPV